MSVPESAVGPAILAITQGIGLFNQFLPKLDDIRRADLNQDPEFAADVRMGEFAAFALLMGIGSIASVLTQTEYPMMVSLVMGIGLVALYEWTLRGNRFSPGN